MKIIKNIAFSILFILGIQSCDPIENYDVAPAKAVVEAYLSPNKPIDMLVTKELPFTDSSNVQRQTIDNLTINIEVDGTSFNLKPEGNGRYKSSFLVDSLKTYKMSFDYNGKKISAETRTLSKPQNFKSSVSNLKIAGGFPPSFPDPVKLNWNNPDNDYFLVVAQNIETSPEAVSTGGPFGGNINNNAARQFRSSPTQTSNSELLGLNFRYYGRYEVVLYKINAEYASLYSDNGNSSINLSQPFTNVNNGLGIFTGLASDTLRITVTK
jgi:Domain of unknown function (DUF4249)